MEKITKIENVLALANVLYAEEELQSYYTAARKIAELQHYAKRLSTIDTHSANGTSYTDDESYKRAVEAVYERIEQVCANFYHQTDPRGCSLYIGHDELNSQNYHTEGVPVLTV